MARKNDGIIWHLMDAPWWVSILFSAGIYVGFTSYCLAWRLAVITSSSMPLGRISRKWHRILLFCF